MRERGQASVETLALMAAAVALAAVVALGVVRLGPPFASVLREALSGVLAPGSATAPGLDDLGQALLAGATSAGADGPTMLDVRTHLRSRLDGASAEAAFSATLKPLILRALADASVESPPGEVTVVGRASEDAWVRGRLHPGFLKRSAEVAAGLLGRGGRLVSVVHDVGFGADRAAEAIRPGYAAGDVVVEVHDGHVHRVVLRRHPDRGFAVIGKFDVGGAPLPGGDR
jgi:hypothetical protein